MCSVRELTASVCEAVHYAQKNTEPEKEAFTHLLYWFNKGLHAEFTRSKAMFYRDSKLWAYDRWVYQYHWT